MVKRASAIHDYAKDIDVPVLTLAFSWLLSRPQVSSVIAGASNADQVAANVRAATTLSRDVVDALDREGYTSLLRAAERSDVDIVDMLLKRHAKVSAQSRQGTTALMIASRLGNAEIVRLLEDELNQNAIVIDRALQNLNAEINRGLTRPEIRTRFAENGIEFTPGSPEDFAAYIQRSRARWAKVISAGGIKGEQ